MCLAQAFGAQRGGAIAAQNGVTPGPQQYWRNGRPKGGGALLAMQAALGRRGTQQPQANMTTGGPSSVTGA